MIEFLRKGVLKLWLKFKMFSDLISVLFDEIKWNLLVLVLYWDIILFCNDYIEESELN